MGRGDDEILVKQRTHNGPHCSRLIIRADMELGWKFVPVALNTAAVTSVYIPSILPSSASLSYSPSLSFPFTACFSFLSLKGL